jgi:non-heme chloroperoxidase
MTSSTIPTDTKIDTAIDTAIDTDIDTDMADQARPGHGVPSQDPNPAAQTALQPKEAQREANSALAGGGMVAGAVAGSAIGAVVGGPVGVVVGAAAGAVAGAVAGVVAEAVTGAAGEVAEGAAANPVKLSSPEVPLAGSSRPAR